MSDRSNGWEAVASQLIALRSPTIGATTLHKWIASLHVRGAVLELGLLFLLPEQKQRDVVRRVAGVLKAGGRFLFTAPVEVGTWPDSLTGRPSVSIGIDGYKGVIDDAGLTLVGEYVDEGENHYYDARKDSASSEQTPTDD
jgi:hypothetical protein